MYNLEKQNTLNIQLLDRKMYFPSLLENAYTQQLLTNIEMEQMKLEMYQLLTKKIEGYTANESSSVPVEIAEAIMQSNLYTIGLALKKFPVPEDALQQIKTTKLSELYQSGRMKINDRLHTAKYFHLLAGKNAVQTKNTTYQATLFEGIQGFFKLYQPDYEAHEIHITLDYPLAIPITDKIGIELIVQYLERIYLENMFCAYFPLTTIEDLLYRMDKHYKENILNIFTTVFTQVLGCTLVGVDAFQLQLTAVQIEAIYQKLQSKSLSELAATLKQATEKIIAHYEINRSKLQDYLYQALPTITESIYQAIQLDTLETLLAPYHEKNMPATLTYTMGAQMNDDIYREMVEELLTCRYASDKIKWIQNEIQSLADLESIVVDAKLTNAEIQSILDALPPIELAVLLKRNVTDDLEFFEEKTIFQQCLGHALTKRTDQAQWVIRQYMQHLIIQA